MRKFRSHRGETLAEVLVALLIVALATMLLASMSAASAGINLTARQKDEEFYEALSQVDAMNHSTKVNDGILYYVTIEEKGTSNKTPIPVNIYTQGNLTAYREATP